jgi:hypothetical protein
VWLESGDPEGPEIDINTSIEYLCAAAPALRSLRLRFTYRQYSTGGYGLNGRNATVGTSAGFGIVDLNPLARLPLESVVLVRTSHVSVTPASVTEWPILLSSTLRSVHFASQGFTYRKTEKMTDVSQVCEFLEENLPGVSVSARE